ncbi:hypothetical protein M3Y99_01942200 [Aphelenchoides fujianensis]|nr:hypothetical protein M3Y99_01942200 [Aphelenchoides fujianensis]
MIGAYKSREQPPSFRPRLSFCAKMSLSSAVFIALIGLVAACVSLPQLTYVNNRPFHLLQYQECRGGKIFEINQVRDIDECKAACLQRDCQAVNLFQLGKWKREFEFKCEILAYVRGYQPMQGAACYVSY